MIPIKLAPSGENATQTLAGAAGRVDAMPAEGRELAAGFAAMLSGAQPGDPTASDVAGEALPASGNPLPSADTGLPPELSATELLPADALPAAEAALPIAVEPAAAGETDAVMAAVPLADAEVADAMPERPAEDPAKFTDLLPPLPAVAEATRVALGQREPATATAWPAIVAAGVDAGAAETALPVAPVAPPLPRTAGPSPRLPAIADTDVATPTALPAAPKRDLPPAMAAEATPAARGIEARDAIAAVALERRAEPLDSALRPLLPATTPSATAATTTPLPMPAAVGLPIGSQRWSEAIGERVLWMSAQKLQSAEIRLNPAELGPLKIEVTMDDGNAQVNFTAHHAVTRDALEQALPRLRDMFNGEGLNLASADVSEQGVRHGRDEQRGGSAGPAAADLGDDERVESGSALPVRVSQGLVDTFA